MESHILVWIKQSWWIWQQECTPGAIQMKLETSIENRMWAARMTKHVMEMNKHLQSRLLDLMQNRLLLSADSTAARKRKRAMLESSRIQEEEQSQLPSYQWLVCWIFPFSFLSMFLVWGWEEWYKGNKITLRKFQYCMKSILVNHSYPWNYCSIWYNVVLYVFVPIYLLSKFIVSTGSSTIILLVFF